MKITTIDFETEEIKKRPDYPPRPVGCAVTEASGKSYYMSWAHPCENNCNKSDAVKILKGFCKESIILCHNGKFDLEVGEKFMGLPLIPKHGWEDSMLLAFLHDPREPSLKLKILADKHLSMKPEEQEKLKQWIFDNVPGAKKAKTKWGKYIHLAPGKLAGRYAKGDTIRTKKLYNLFYKHVKGNDMLEQYEIEKRCVIESIYMERVGIRVDEKALKPELKKAELRKTRAENKIRKVLGDINLGSWQQKYKAFDDLGLVDEWEYNEKGNPCTGIDALMRTCNSKPLVSQLEIYSKYKKLISTYIKPWLLSAKNNNGLYYPWINTIKGDNEKGAYTGRMSSNFQQVPKEPDEVFKGMPFLRNFIMPDRRGHTLLNRDYMGQELRILAHFGDGVLLVAYNNNPMLDGHKFVQDTMLENTDVFYKKSIVKGCNFLIIYGGGAPALSKNLGIPLHEAEAIFKVHGDAVPEVKELKEELRILNKRGGEFVTAGGRIYDFEDGYEYVALNTLIQGSAADHTKRGMLNVIDAFRENDLDARITLPIHDEFMVSGATRKSKKIMKVFKDAMEKDKLFDVPMSTDGKIGARWGSMTKYKD